MKLSPVILSLFASSLLPQSSLAAPRIIGGVQATANQWPWMVALVSADEPGANGFFCGGTLISDRYVLTAAHCLETNTESQIKVYAGSQSLASGGQRLDVDQIVLPSGYEPNLSSPDYDIALLRLKQPTSMTPIRLDLERSLQLADGSSVAITGWGTLDGFNNASSYPKALQQVNLPLITRQSCLQYESSLSPNMFCAGLPEGGKDSCFGDSGGPMMYLQGSTWNQIGIVSWGGGCAEANSPGVYTDLSSQAINLWLKQQLQQAAVNEVLQFSQTLVGESSSQTTVVYNDGTSPVVIGEFKLNNTAELQTISNSCSGQTLAVNSSCTIKVQFKPTQQHDLSAQASLVVGNNSRSIKITGSVLTPLSKALDYTNNWSNQGKQNWLSADNLSAEGSSLAEAKLSQSGDTAIIAGELTLAQNSIFSFAHQWSNTSNSSFKLFVNNKEQDPIPSSSSLQSYSLEMPAGTYQIRWELRQTSTGNSSARLDHVGVRANTSPSNGGGSSSANKTSGGGGGGSLGVLSLLLGLCFSYRKIQGKTQ